LPTRILIVDDHALIRKGLVSLLKSNLPDWEIHEASNGVEAVLKAARIRPDIILMDYYMPRLNGAQAASVITRDLPQTKVLMISMNESPEYIIRTIQSGVKGIIPKDSSEQEVMDAIRDVGNGKTHLHERVAGTALDFLNRDRRKTARNRHSASDLLTDRELEIIELLVKGVPQPDILPRLAISKRTLETHKSNIFRKLQVHSTAEMIRYAVRNKLVPY